MRESALIVAVPEAEPVVGRHRRDLDHSALWGVPAHVTVLYPFVPPDRIDADTIEAVRAVISAVPAFDCVFARVAWFEGTAAYLEPAPGDPFRALTFALWQRFPDYPPYGGEHPDPIPHLTIGSTRRADLASLGRAAAEVEPLLPVRARIDQVRLITGSDAPDSWRTNTEFPLA